MALQTRLDAADEMGRRAEAYYKDRFSRWKHFKQWMEDQEKEYKIKTKGLRTADKTRNRDALYLRRRQKLKEMGLDVDDDDFRESETTLARSRIRLTWIIQILHRPTMKHPFR